MSSAPALRQTILQGLSARKAQVVQGRPGGPLLELGATWQEVATALDCTPDEARDVLRSYADGQRRLYEGDEREGRKPIGFTAERHRAALALTELADDESAAAEEDR